MTACQGHSRLLTCPCGTSIALQLSDYGLVADLFTALPELEQEIAKVKGGGAEAA
jgi:hypothetical protein